MKLRLIAEIQRKGATTGFRRSSASNVRKDPQFQNTVQNDQPTKKDDSKKNRPKKSSE